MKLTIQNLQYFCSLFFLPKRKTDFFRLVVFFILTVGVWLSLGSGQTFAGTGNSLEKVSLQLKWYHQFQFAGYYAAKAQGFYQEEGLDVTIVEGGPPNPSPLESVLSGQAQYGVLDGELLNVRLRGEPVVLLAVIFQHSPNVLMSRKDSGITKPSDFIGRTIMFTKGHSEIEFKSIFIYEGVPLDKIKFVPHTGSIDPIIDRRVDADTAYLTNEPYMMLKRGVEPALLKPIDYGIDFYGDSLFTTENEIRLHPERVGAFRRASIKGWEYALNNIDEMIDLIMTFPSVKEHNVTAAQLQFEAEKMKELIQPQLIEIGHVNPLRWKHMADTLVHLKLFKPDYSLDGFIYDPNPKPDYKRLLLAIGIITSILLFVGICAIVLLLFNRRLAREVVERKQSEAQLVKAKKEWEYTFDAIADIITIQDKDMHIVRANKAAHDFFQVQYGELNGKRCYELFTGGSEPCSECPQLATLQDIGKHSIIIQHENLGKFFQVSSSAVLADNGDIQYLVHVAKDITEQKKQEQLAQQISRQQEQLKRFESLRTMAGAIAHRFNNAMMAVQGNLELMLITLPDNLKEKKLASDALRAAKGASLVGSMMLSYLGQRPLHLQVSSLSELAGECATELKNQMEPSISLKVISPPAPLICSMDKEQIREVLTNILINAIESLNDEAGEIEISFGTDHFEVASFPVVFQDNDTKNGMYIFCQIRDTGQGIPAENLQRLFEPFFTTKFVGRGLGLALSVGVMRLHHGAILVESKPGAGTTVRILLPGMEHSEKEITSSAGSKKDVVKLSGDLLFADDDDLVRDLGKRMLETLGFTIHTAVNGLEAVEMVQRQDINFRAVVLDISMPVMDGMEAMREIKKSNPDLPILLSSGYSEKDFPIEKDLATKPDGFLQKPFLFSDLQQSLEKLLS